MSTRNWRIKYQALFYNLLLLFLFNSCATITQGQLYFIDRKTGVIILNNEVNVKVYLEEMICNPEQYNISVLKRSPLRYQKRTKTWEHTFFVINNPDGEFHTLSFYGTVFTFYSEGAWALDTDYDYIPYKLYLYGKNDYDILEIWKSDDINFVETIKNIIKKIDSNNTYYLLDHVNNKDNMDNCNTAVIESIVLTLY